jgi:hypothetical protein
VKEQYGAAENEIRASTHSSSGPLTFDINGEIIFSSRADQVVRAELGVFSPSPAFIHPFHRKLPSAQS